MAQKKGWLDGLEVEDIHVTGDANAMRALLSGNADIGPPFIMAGIRLAVGLAIIGIIVAEFFTAISGLGGMIVEYANVFATAKLFVPIIVIAIVGVVLTELVMWLERRMSRWRQLERERF